MAYRTHESSIYPTIFSNCGLVFFWINWGDRETQAFKSLLFSIRYNLKSLKELAFLTKSKREVIVIGKQSRNKGSVASVGLFSCWSRRGSKPGGRRRCRLIRTPWMRMCCLMRGSGLKWSGAKMVLGSCMAGCRTLIFSLFELIEKIILLQCLYRHFLICIKRARKDQVHKCV